MSKENIETVVKILKSLPDSQQERFLDHLCEYIADFQDELHTVGCVSAA